MNFEYTCKRTSLVIYVIEPVNRSWTYNSFKPTTNTAIGNLECQTSIPMLLSVVRSSPSSGVCAPESRHSSSQAEIHTSAQSISKSRLVQIWAVSTGCYCRVRRHRYQTRNSYTSKFTVRRLIMIQAQAEADPTSNIDRGCQSLIMDAFKFRRLWLNHLGW